MEVRTTFRVMYYNVGSDSDESDCKPLFLQGSGFCAVATGDLDCRLVRGGTSTPNFSVRDGVQPLFQSAASPLSDRSFLSDSEPSPAAAFTGPLLEPLLEFAARHVPIPFDPVSNSDQSLLEFASMHGTSQDRCRPFRSGAGDNQCFIDRGSPGAQRLEASRHRPGFTGSPTSATSLQWGVVDRSVQFIDRGSPVAQRLEASCHRPRFTGSPTSATPLHSGVVDRSLRCHSSTVSQRDSTAERPLTTGQSPKRQSSHASHHASPDNLDHRSGHGRTAEIVLPFPVMKEDFPSPPRGVSCSLGKSRQSSSSTGKRKNMGVAAAPPTSLPVLPASTAPLAPLPASHVPAPGLKNYALPGPLILPDHVPGSAHPVHETRKEIENYTALVNTELALAVMTPSMIQRCLGLRAGEVDAINCGQWRNQVVINLNKSAGISLRNAVTACNSLRLFCFTHFGIELIDFGASPGLISIYLSAHMAPTMPAYRLASLKTAKARFGADCDADHPSLQPYAVRVRKGGHASAASLKMVCQLLHLAKQGPTVYVRAYAGAFAVMALTSLRWIDAIRSGLPVRRTDVDGDTLDGVAFRQKSKAGSPMLWWCPVLDFFGESGWYSTLSEVLTKMPRCDFLFPKFCGKSLLMSSDSLSTSARIHGLRRVIPIVARLLSAKLHLTNEDRCELGRWVSALCIEAGAPFSAAGKAGSMPNIYSDEAHRPRAVQIRELVLGAIRDYFSANPDWLSLPDADDFLALARSAGGLRPPTIFSPEPSPDEEELEGE